MKAKRCKFCRCSIPLTRTSKALFCSPECQVKAKSTKGKTATAHRRTEMQKAYGNAFFSMIARECQRAGTVQIMQGHTLESLTSLYSVWKRLHRINGNSSNGVKYKLGHICPVKGVTKAGVLAADNVVIQPAEHNRKHGASHFGLGRWIEHNALLPEWAVGETSKKEAVINKLAKLLGKATIESFVKLHKLKTTRKIQLLDKLSGMAGHEFSPSQLEKMSTQALEALKCSIDGTKERKAGTFKEDSFVWTPDLVLRDELARLSRYYPELAPVAQVVLDWTVSTAEQVEGTLATRYMLDTDFQRIIAQGFDMALGAKPCPRTLTKMLDAANDSYMAFVLAA